MAKILRVIDPFFGMEAGDTFEYDEKSGMYVYQRKEEYYENDDSSLKEIKSIFSTNFQISADYAKNLVEEGYLEEVTELTDKTPFVNIFDEIDTLLDTYTAQLSNIDTEMKDIPACIKVERQTVLQNMITLLKHLKSLKK